MKRLSILIVVTIIFISCNKKYSPRNIESVTIKEFPVKGSSIRALHAIDKDTLFYAGSNGDVGFTNDAGKSWDKKEVIYNDSIKPHFRSIAYNGNDFFALSIESLALLYKINSEKVELLYIDTHPKIFYDSMHFFDDQLHGIAVGDPTEDCASILLTSDAGETWNKLPCNKLPQIAEGEAFFAASNTNIKTIGSTVWIISGGTKARVLKSDDYGNTWQIYTTPIIQGDGPQGMYAVDFYDKNNGIVVGGDYSKPLENNAVKAITKNGGKTWNLVANNQSPNFKSCVKYIPNTNGKEILAVGKTGISFSNDEGVTWKEVSKESYYAIQFVDKNTAWLSGHQKIGKLTIESNE